MSEKGKTTDFPGFDAAQHRSMLAGVDASKTVNAEKSALDPSLAVPPPMPPE